MYLAVEGVNGSQAAKSPALLRQADEVFTAEQDRWGHAVHQGRSRRCPGRDGAVVIVLELLPAVGRIYPRVIDRQGGQGGPPRSTRYRPRATAGSSAISLHCPRY